jgi:hypothetical protein
MALRGINAPFSSFLDFQFFKVVGNKRSSPYLFRTFSSAALSQIKALAAFLRRSLWRLDEFTIQNLVASCQDRKLLKSECHSSQILIKGVFGQENLSI